MLAASVTAITKFAAARFAADAIDHARTLRRVLSGICAPLTTLPVDELTEILPSLIETSPEAQGSYYDGSGTASAIPGGTVRRFPAAGRTVNRAGKNTVGT